jgi:hypothetical protein
MRLLALLFLLSACEGETGPLDGGTELDAGKDAAIDTGFPDAGRDAGGEDIVPGDTGACSFNPNCAGCQEVDECCFFSINCVAGAICNQPSDPFYDPEREEDICIQVVCQNDSDCEAPKVCTAERLCRDPVCQEDNQCPGGQVCLGGECTTPPDPSQVASCRVIGRNEVVRIGGAVLLEMVARNAAGDVLPGIVAVWTSSLPARVSIGSLPTPGIYAAGGMEAGPSELTASVGAIDCEGALTVTNFLGIAADEFRVIALEHGTGLPLEGATIIVGSETATTGPDGSALLIVTGPVDAVTALAPNHATVSLMLPTGREIVLPLPRIDPTIAGGIRGNVDISSSRPADMPLAIVGESFSSDIFSLGRTPLMGRDRILTVIDAPELGLDMEQADFPGGFLFGLGDRRFMDAPVRCQGNSPGPEEVGCFLVRTDEGDGAAWTVGGSFRLAEITSIANELSDVLSGDPVAQLTFVDKLMPALRKLSHGTEPSIVSTDFPRGPNGAPDFARYQETPLAADEPLAVTTVVEVPTLAAPTLNSCADAASVVGAVYLGRRGLVPLGFGSAADIRATEVPDCVVTGAEQPFGENSDRLEDGEVGLSTAPRHAGLEGHPLALISIARSGFPGDGTAFFRSVRIERMTSFPERATPGPWLSVPQGTVDAAGAMVSFNGTQGNLTRVELYGAGMAWIVYAPGDEVSFALPDVPARAVLSDLQNVMLIQADINVTYENMFDLAALVRADRNFEIVDRFVISEAQ